MCRKADDIIGEEDIVGSLLNGNSIITVVEPSVFDDNMTSADIEAICIERETRTAACGFDNRVVDCDVLAPLDLRKHMGLENSSDLRESCPRQSVCGT